MDEIIERGREIVMAVPAPALAAMGFGAGLALLLFGWRIYRVALVSVGVLAGGAIGTAIAVALRVWFHLNLPAVVLAIPIGVLLGLVTLKLEKIGAFLAGGACGALPILMTFSTADYGNGLYLAAGLAFLLGGLLAVLLWRPMIILSLAVLGAALIGQCALLSSDLIGRFDLRRLAAQYPYVWAAAMGILAMLGCLFQMRLIEEKPEDKKSEKNPGAE